MWICARSNVVNFDVYLKILKNTFTIKFNFVLDIIVYKNYFVLFPMNNSNL